MAWALLLAGSLYAANLLLGLALQLRWLRLRWRWPHHLLYAAVFASTALALLLALLTGAAWLGLAWSCALLTAMPFTRPGRPDHAALAGLVGLGYFAASGGL
ncbi:apolipoprotein N-acyltransferase [Deinobacterium chartae]|uniref:Apolipoprotein N-acyltransferase n=1 Tax=Deinobacterium chartae TaxID=521158 RepID=A0A841I1T6_9DEIO|nr:hypothetical protein [Deinobacterium chartae]MBB6098278.1 apolipoprotein N-acyltransferase [Deinobacterium chartae]